MSDAYNFLPSFFSDDPKTGAPTYAQLEARRKIAMALATRNRPYPKTIGEGLTAFGEGLGEGINLNRLQRAETAQGATDAEGAARLRGDIPVLPPAAPGQVSSDVDPTMNALALASPEQAESVPPQVKLASMPIEEWKQRVKRNESGGQPDPYRAIGPVSRRGDYPYGAYQVMGENIPKWTKAYLGKEMTPQEFLDSPEAQERVADGQGGKYLAKLGPVGAAEAWFAGEKGRLEGRSTRKDTLGTHIDEYVRRFNVPLVNRDQVTASAVNAPAAPPPMALAEEEAAQPPVQLPGQVAALDTGTVSDAPPVTADPRAAVASALAAQQQPPPPPPQQVAQAGGGALPVVPPSMPIVQPQTIPKAPATPAQPADPGPEPKLRDYIEGDPRLQKQMRDAQEVRDDRKYNDSLRAQAAKKYEELEKRANDAYGKQWTIWHERTKAREAFKLTEEEKGLQTTKLRGEAEDAAEERIQKQRFGMDPKEWHKNFKTEQNSAEVAGRMMSDNQLIIKAVKDGVIMGTGAGWRLNVTKLAAWAAQNGYASEVAANSEIARALSGSRIREAMSQINPSGPASNIDLLISKQLSGTDPIMEPKSFMTLLHKSNEFNAKVLNDFEDKRDYFLSGTRAERNYAINTSPTAPKEYVDALLQNRDDKAARAAYNERFGEGAAQLEIERFKRRTRRGQ